MNSNPRYIISYTEYDNFNAYFRNSEMKKIYIRTLHARENSYLIILVDTIGINCRKLNKIIMK